MLQNPLPIVALFFLGGLVGPGTSEWQLGPFVKHSGNPILSPRGETWESKDVFNPAAWTDGETVWLVYRAEDRTGPGRWNGTSRIGLATSSDGLSFRRRADPILGPSESWETPGGCEDPRLVQIGDIFYLTYTAYDGQTARLALATSKDLISWTKHGLIFPDRGWSKSGAILRTPVDGRYWMYFGDKDIRAAHSRDLREWEVIEKPVLVHRARTDAFDSQLVEPGPPPIMTEDGILLLFNGANDRTEYAAGQALFDKSDPTRLLARSDSPFFQPTLLREKKGQVPEVVFIEGLVHFGGKWLLYYGMADSHIGVASFDPVNGIQSQ